MLSQVRQIRFYSADTSLINSASLNPFFVTGFADGEGCFWISISKDKGFNTGWRVRLYFEIHIHKKDQVLLEQIKNFYDVGKTFEKHDNSIQYLVSSVKDLQVIRKHFEKYPLHTKKRADFELWIKVLDLIQNKEHLTVQGLQKIVAIRASLNRGLTDELKAAFPTIVPVQRPNVENIIIRDPYWLAGFSSGEGMFLIKILKSKAKTGVTVRLVFQLTQHTRDEQLMRSLIEYFDCGFIRQNKDAFIYRVQNFSDIENKILPFFSKHRILGVKFLDYQDWCKAAERKLI